MGSKRGTRPASAREYAHEAAIGVDRKRKKALLGKPTTPVKARRGTTVSQLLDSYRKASFQARAVGNCAAVFEGMLRDRQRPTIFLGLAGSLIAAGMRQVIVDLIEGNMVDVVVSTGAIISQDFYQVRGGRHYHGSADADDKELRDLYIDRLYDTFMDEEKYWQTDLAVSRAGGTVWELAAAGTPSVLVPYPYATADHQTLNARHFEDGGGAVVVPDPEVGRIPQVVAELLESPERLAAMRESMLRLARPDAADVVADELVALARGGR